jgi:UDP-GlcNAc:undecaprenyl-phosphate GlcNAc-1-phosphate transferase
MWLYAFCAFVLSASLTYLVRYFALKYNVIDKPNGGRKLHGRPVPLLGGVALFLSFWTVVGYVSIVHPIFGIERITGELFAAFVASTIILAVGIKDEIKGLPAGMRLFLTAFATFAAVFFGLGLKIVTNPFGGVISLTNLVGDVLVFIWLMGMMYTTKITDGLDGLSTGIVAIGSLMLFFLSSSVKFFQPNVALLCLIFFSVCMGFLLFNFPPASIFLGESGSLFIGLILGVLAVISGGKVATALLAMAIPVLDLASVIYQRKRAGRPIFEGDRRHLHFRLVDRGLSSETVVILYYLLAGIFGSLALMLQSTGKIIVLVALVVLMVVVGLRIPEQKKI